MPWTGHVRAGRDFIRRAFDAANERSDLTWAAYSRTQLITNLLASGEQLAEAQREAEDSLAFERKVRFGRLIDIVTTQLALIRTLRGLTPKFGCLDDGDMDEPRMEHHLSSNPVLAIPACWYWIRKLQARYLAGDYTAAMDASSKAQRLLWTSPSQPETMEFCFYGALSCAAFRDLAPPDQKQQHFEALKAHHNQLDTWAQNCPENFENRAALVGAEIARIEGRDLDAERLYEQAIGSARANGFVHNEALAYELAARFYAARGFKQIADLYLREARRCYLRWGASGKVRQLDETYPDIRQEDSLPGPMSTIGAPVEHLDLATVIRVSQAVSSEIVLENLIDTLMHTAMEQAGAERALLILPWGQEPRIGAEATTSGDTVTVRLVDEAVTERVLPESVLHYVLRTREIVILDDAEAQSPFGVDSYIRRRQARSILCLPLLNQAKLIGVLYLENNLTPRVFAPARISVLKLLASQAAIALENAHLYRNVAEREKQQTATSDMLRLISNSPIHSVLDAVAENAARLCDANNAEIFRLEDNLLRLAASYGEIPVVIHAYQGVPVNRDTVTGRAACDRRTIHVHDLAAEEGEYPVGSSNAKREGHRTTLATPLLREGTPVGIILVRRRKVRPFSDQQIALLETFADQAVIAIENARLFESEKQRGLALAHANRDLAERETKIRRLVDSNIIGIFIWDFYGRILEANDEFLRMVSYDREDLVSGRIRWADLTPPDWRDRNNARIEQQKSSGRFEPFEKEYTRKDGSRVPVLIGGATFEEGGNEGVAFVLDLTQRKRAEEKSRESELKLRQIIETVPGLVWSNGPDGEPTHVNQRMLDYSGMQLEEFRHRGWEAFVHPADYPGTAEAFWRAIQTGTSYQGVMRLRRADGEFRWHDARCEPLRDRRGNIIQWYGLCFDIDEGKKAEDLLRRSEAHLAEAQRLSHTGAVAYNGTAILFASEETYHIWGFDPAQGLPSREVVFQRIHPGDRDWLSAEVRRAVGEKRRFSIAYRILLPDGTVKHLETIGQPVFSASGKLVEIFATQTDVTERKRAEQALMRSEAYLAQAQKLTHTGSWAWDPRTEKVLYCSEEMFRIFGLDPRESSPSRDNFRQQIHPEDRDWVKKRFEESLRERVDTFAEYRVVLSDGTVRHINASGHLVLNEDSELIEFIGTAADVTERKRLEERLRVQHTVAQILAEAAAIEEATPRILRAIGEYLGWDVGAFWRVDREAGALRCVEIWHKASIEVPEFERVSREFTFVPGLGLPGRVWSSLEPEYVPDVVSDENFPRVSIAEREGLHAAFGFPILLGSEVLGVIECFSREIRQPDQELLNMLATIGSQIGQFIERKRAEQALRESEAKFRDYAETASDWLCEIGPDYKYTLLSENAFGSGAAHRIGSACWDHD